MSEPESKFPPCKCLSKKKYNPVGDCNLCGDTATLKTWSNGAGEHIGHLCVGCQTQHASLFVWIKSIKND